MRAPGRIRTCDSRFRKPQLYPLSYEGIRPYRTVWCGDYHLCVTDTQTTSHHIRQLLTLLRLLPDSTERNWWDRYAYLHHQMKFGGAGHSWSGDYLSGSIEAYEQIVSGGRTEPPTLDQVRKLAEYCLLFFDVADDQALCEHLSRWVAPSRSVPAGRRWAQQVCENAFWLWAQGEGNVRPVKQSRFEADVAARFAGREVPGD